MGRRGPIPKSRTAKILTGNFRRDRPSSPGIIPTPSARAPRPPKDFTPEEREIWRYYAPELARIGLLDNLSLTSFTMLVQLLAQHQEVNQRLVREGLTYTTKRGIPRVNPLVSVEKKLWLSCFVMLKEFGLTPLSRQRLGITYEPPKPQSKLSKFLSNGPQAS